MKAHFPGLKGRKFPRRVLAMDFENDILPAERKLIEKYGFVKEEINFIIKRKPAFILFEKEGSNEGLLMLNKYLVEERGFQPEVLKTLIMRYPYILSKNYEQINTFFKTLGDYNLSEEEIMKYLLECPRLISFDL